MNLQKKLTNGNYVFDEEQDIDSRPIPYCILDRLSYFGLPGCLLCRPHLSMEFMEIMSKRILTEKSFLSSWLRIPLKTLEIFFRCAYETKIVQQV